MARVLTVACVVAAALAGCSLLGSAPSAVGNRFPDTLGGEPFDVHIDRGGHLGPEMDIVPALGIDLGDVVVVACRDAVAEGEGELGCMAYQYPGVEGQLLAETYISHLQALGGTLRIEPRGGRLGWIHEDGPHGEIFIFVRHDAIYLLSGNEQLMDELVAAIP